MHTFKTKKMTHKLTLALLCALTGNVNANVVGKISGDLSVGQGAVSYQLSLPMPAGIHDMSPAIILEYSAQATNGIVGPGFKLNASSAISRCTANKMIDDFEAGIQLDATSRFCHDGQKLVSTSGNDGENGTEYLAYNNNNVKYTSNGGSNYTPNTWTAHTPSGYELSFSREGHNDGKFATWLLDSKTDHFGNVMNFTYSEDILPLLQTISYSGYEITFVYEAKRFGTSNYLGGELVNNNQRLEKVIVTPPDSTQAVYFFTFSYEELTSPVSVERLSEVTQCFGDDESYSPADCLRPVQFHYQSLPDSTNVIDRQNDDLTITIPDDFYNPTGGAYDVDVEERPSYSAADVTGNGYADFCYYKLGTGIICAEHNGSSYETPSSWSGDLGYNSDNDYEDYQAYSSLNLFDLNLDGKADVCITDEDGIRCGISNGEGFSITSDANSLWTTAINKSFMGISYAYVDNDEYIDICGTDENGVYRCLAGDGTSFSTEILSFNDIDFHKSVEWTADLNCTQHGCTRKEESFEVNFASPTFLDIDGDFDKDLCWISHDQEAFVCRQASTNPSNNLNDRVLSYGPSEVKFDLSALITKLPTVTPHTYSSSEHTSWLNTSTEAVSKINKLSAGFRLANLNGDALIDVCYVVDEAYQCRINTGTEYGPEVEWLDLADLFSGKDEYGINGLTSTFRFVDRDLDGLADLCVIHSEYEKCAYSTGSSLADFESRLKIYPDIQLDTNQVAEWGSFMHKLFGGSRIRFNFETVRGGYGNLLEIGDINDDGYPELCYRSIWGIACSTNDNYGPRSLLTGVTDSYGLHSAISYASLASSGRYESLDADDIPDGFREHLSNNWVVASIETDTATADKVSGATLTNRVDYSYGGLLISDDGELAGFANMTETQAARDIITTTHFYTDEDLFGQQRLLQTRINGTLVKQQENNMSVAPDSENGTRRLQLDSTVDTQYNLDGTLQGTTTTANTDIDEYGFPETITTIKTLGDETLTVETKTTYLHDSASWLLGRADYQTVTHSYNGDVEIRTVDYEYTDGKLTSQIIQPDADNQLTISYSNFTTTGYPQTVSSQGMADYEETIQTRSVTKTYDSLGRVLTETNALNHVTTYTYHATCGKVETITDIADRVTTIGYNNYCEKISEDFPDANQTSWTYEWATQLDQSAALRSAEWPAAINYYNPIVYKVTESRASDSEYGNPQSISYFDAQGRAVRSLSTGFSSSSSDRDVKTETVYNQFGYRTGITAPYYVLNGLQGTPRWTTFSYDSIGRVSSEVKTGPDGNELAVNYTYSSNTSNIAYSDYSKSTVNGVHGKPSSVTENGLTVNYSYTPAGSLYSTDTNGLVTSVTYDERGLKIGQNDPSMGIWEYKHNAFGELVYQKDAKEQEVKMYYDVLGRLTSKVSAEGTSSWSYYSSGNGKGQVREETGTEVTKSWIYNDKGLVFKETLTVDDEIFETEFTYDIYSRLIETKHPEDISIFSKYDNIGLLQNVSMKARDVKNVDFNFLVAEKDRLMVELERLKNLQQAALNKAKYHSEKAEEYHSQYLFFLDKFNSVNDSINTLSEIAREHQDTANQYISVYRALLARAEEISLLYGSGHSYKKEHEDSEYYYYARSYCTSKHGWGPTRYCARFQTDQIRVPKSELLIQSPDGTQELLSVPDVINPVSFFTGLANKYQNYAHSHQEVTMSLTGTEDQPSVFEQTVTALDEQSLQYLYQYIAKEVELQEYKYSYMEFLHDDKISWIFAPITGDICICSESGFLTNIDRVTHDRDILIENIKNYQIAAGASDEEIILLGLLLDYLEKVSFIRIVELSDRFQSETDFIHYGALARQADNVDLSALLSLSRSQAASIKSELNTKESLTPRFFSNPNTISILEDITNGYSEAMFFSKFELTPGVLGDYYQIDLPITQSELAVNQQLLVDLSISSEQNESINETHTKPVDRVEYEDRLIPITVGGIVTFVPATVAVTYTDLVEITVAEAQVYYKEQYEFYHSLMLNSINSSAAQISDLEDNISGDLAAAESALASVQEALFIVDEDGAASLAQSQQDLYDSHGKLTLWHAAKRTPEGYLQTEIFGNGLYTNRTLSTQTGLVTDINTALVGGNSLRQLTYTYDERGRITGKVDTNDMGNTTTETFEYTDSQGRLSDWSYGQTIVGTSETQNYSLTYAYEHDDLGNLTSKTDAGTMTYDPLTNRLDSRTHDDNTYSYTYDDNGNTLTGDGRTYVWTSFNKARSVTANGQSVTYAYDASHQRVMKTTSSETRYYVSPSYERVEKAGETIHRFTIWADGDAVAVVEKRASTQSDQVEEAKIADKIAYIHRDILGSGELITDSRMQVVSRNYFSPYGSHINDLIESQKAQYEEQYIETAVVSSVQDQGLAVWNEFDQNGEGDELFSRYIAGESLIDLSGVRGFTSHESIEEVNLINMNARLFDPLTGRFMSADTMIPDIGTPLDYNRYSYVRGNPVIARDPTGHFPWQVVAALALYSASHYGDSQSWQMASSFILQITMMNPQVGIMGDIGKHTLKTAMFSSAVTNLTMSYLQTGKIGRKSIESAGIAAASAAVPYLMANGSFNTTVADLLGVKELNWGHLTAMHMVSQGVISDLRGDKFITGAVSALASKIGSYATRGLGDPLSIQRTVAVAAFGGMAARATGGDFLQGALTAAMVHLFNELSNPAEGTSGQYREYDKKEMSKFNNAGFNPHGESIGSSMFSQDRLDFCASDPQLCVTARSVYLEADRVTRELFRGGGSDNDVDAFRHAFASFRLAQRVGYERTIRITDAYEVMNLSNGARVESVLMDLRNNRTGASMGFQSPSSNINDAIKMIRAETIYGGSLQVLNP